MLIPCSNLQLLFSIYNAKLLHCRLPILCFIKCQAIVFFPIDIEKYQTLAPYSAEEDDEISFPQSAVAEVLQKSLTGWWLIRCDGYVGLAPATYLKKIPTETLVRELVVLI